MDHSALDFHLEQEGLALRPYQYEAYDFLTARKRVIYGDGPGTGKTPTTLAYASIAAYNALVVAPKSVTRHWAGLAETWFGGDVVFVDGSAAKRRKAYEQFALYHDAAYGQLLVTHYEAMRTDIDFLRAFEFDHVFFDEAHRLKNRKAAVRKAAAGLVRKADGVAFLTGTPILNHAEELWSLLNMLAPGHYTSYWRWAHEHFVCKTTDFRGRLPQPVTIVGDLLPGHDQVLRNALAGVLIQRPLEMLLPDMPEVTSTDIYVTLSPEERRHYDQMRKFDWTEIAGEAVVATTDVVRQGRLRQLASDWTAFGVSEPGTKVKAALDLVADLGEPVVVFTAYKATAQAMAGALGDAARLFTGDQSGDERRDAVLDFVEGKARVIVGTIGAMAEGVDGLQAVCRQVVFVDRDWTPARNDQAVARVRRSGQDRGVQVWNIVALDTVDETVAAALAAKQDVVDAVLNTWKD